VRSFMRLKSSSLGVFMLGICIVFELSAQTASSSVKSNLTKKKTDSQPKANDPIAQSKSSDALATAALQAASTQDSEADYVPCKFTYAQLQSLAVPERKTTFSPADAERFVESVVTETLGQQASGLLDETTAQAIVGSLDNSAFVGLTPSQALAVVMRTLAVVRNTARVQNDLNQAEKRAQANEPVTDSKSAIAGLFQDGRSAWNQAEADLQLLPPSEILANVVRAASVRANGLQELAGLDDQKLASLKAAGQGSSYAGSTRTQILEFENPSLRQWANSFPSTEGSGGATTLPSGSKSNAPTASEKLNNESIITASAQNVTAAAGIIVGRARRSLDMLMRPDDVGCAMSVLSSGETQRAYGRLVANRYIAIQIVVRNLNQDQAFILHDAELAVNIDPNGLLGRFYSGRDKVIVRQIANSQQFFDPRNLVVHSAEAIGAIMSSGALVFGGALADATNVYQTGFYQSLSKAWRDMSVDQINLLNDTGQNGFCHVRNVRSEQAV
jgi:hypothetical protein